MSYDLVHAVVGANKEKMDKVDLDLYCIVVLNQYEFCLVSVYDYFCGYDTLQPLDLRVL